MKHAIVHDLDGTLMGGSGGTMFPRAERFSQGSFFGLPFKDPVNHRQMRNRSLEILCQLLRASSFAFDQIHCLSQLFYQMII